MRTILDISDFHKRLGRGERPQHAVRFAPASDLTTDAASRTVKFVFSDGSVDRYGDTIDARGWVLDAFNANPIALFGHDASCVENVIGRAKNVRVEGNQLVGEIEFASAEVNPNAESVFRMVEGGFLKTVSVGFQPLEWSLSKDRSRPGGVDFKRQELLEISVVPIPANPNALVQAKAAGIDVDRLALMRAPKMAVNKGLYEVSWLACLLADLSWLEEMVEWEAEYEGDESPVPLMLADAINQLGQTLIAMTVEEVTEMLAEENAEKRISGLMRQVVECRKRSTDLTPLVSYAAMDTAGDIEVGKAGKTISASTEKAIRDAHALISQGCDMMMKMVEPGEPEPDEDDPAAESTVEKEARDRRERRAKALKLKHVLAA